MSKGILHARLEAGELLCAEGYLFELERRGYLQAGAFVPEVVLEAPEVVEQLHREFCRAGTDVLVALTYYANREKLRIVNREDALERMNRKAIRLAKNVAADYEGVLVAGNICNTNVYDPDDPASHEQVREIFGEQARWAKEEGADFLLAETIEFLGEAKIAVEAGRAENLDVALHFALHRTEKLRDGADVVEACREIEAAGAAVVGLNCIRGPWTMLPIIKRIRDAVSIPVAALPVAYRTTEAEPTFGSLTDSGCPACTVASPSGRPFPVALDPFLCTRYEMADFVLKCREIDVRFIGVCCGGGPHHVRSMAEALGRSPEASRYSVDMSKHFAFGTDKRLKPHNRGYVDEL